MRQSRAKGAALTFTGDAITVFGAAGIRPAGVSDEAAPWQSRDAFA